MPKSKRDISLFKGRHTPYAKRFSPPSNYQVTAAFKDADDKENFSVVFELLNSQGFETINRPISGIDWLARYNEVGQTYSQFLADCSWMKHRKRFGMLQSFDANGRFLKDKYPRGKIYLLPFGIMDHSMCPDFDDIRCYAERFFGYTVELLPEMVLECKENKILLHGVQRQTRSCSIQIASRISKASGHFQLQVGSVLKYLKSMLPEDAIVLTAFTTCDLFFSKSDLFVAGMAAPRTRVGVVSFYRSNPLVSFCPQKWYRVEKTHKPDEEDVYRRIMLFRSNRLLVHEICHLFGFGHCIWYNCLMNGSGHLEEDFKQSTFLCPVDLRKLQSLFGFSVAERYGRLGQYFAKHQFKAEENMD